MKSSYLQDAFSNFIDYPILSEDTLRTANSLHMEFTFTVNINMEDPISAKGLSYVTLTTGNSFSVYLKFL